jgi:hypothetical protein
VELGQRIDALEEEIPKLEARLLDELQLRETKKKNLVVYGFQKQDGDSDRTAITKLLDVVGAPADVQCYRAGKASATANKHPIIVQFQSAAQQEKALSNAKNLKGNTYPNQLHPASGQTPSGRYAGRGLAAHKAYHYDPITTRDTFLIFSVSHGKFLTFAKLFKPSSQSSSHAPGHTISVVKPRLDQPPKSHPTDTHQPPAKYTTAKYKTGPKKFSEVNSMIRRTMLEISITK